MSHGVTVWHIEDLVKCASQNHACVNGRYTPARPYGWQGIVYKLKAAWLVITEKVDVVTWEGQ